MKYIPLSSLQNQYPSISKYRSESNSVSIKGIYEENELNIPLSDFSDLGVVPNTKFRFVVRLFNSEQGNQVINTFTSEGYFNDLARAIQNKNPYFINTALNPKTFVNLYFDNLKETFDKRVLIEKQYGVNVIFNTPFDSDGSIDYLRFGQYIDWVASQPKLDEIAGNGLLNSTKISQFNIEDFNLPETPDDDGFVDPTEGPGLDFVNPNEITEPQIRDTTNSFPLNGVRLNGNENFFEDERIIRDSLDRR